MSEHEENQGQASGFILDLSVAQILTIGICVLALFGFLFVALSPESIQPSVQYNATSTPMVITGDGASVDVPQQPTVAVITTEPTDCQKLQAIIDALPPSPSDQQIAAANADVAALDLHGMCMTNYDEPVVVYGGLSASGDVNTMSFCDADITAAVSTSNHELFRDFILSVVMVDGCKSDWVSLDQMLTQSALEAQVATDQTTVWSELLNDWAGVTGKDASKYVAAFQLVQEGVADVLSGTTADFAFSDAGVRLR